LKAPETPSKDCKHTNGDIQSHPNTEKAHEWEKLFKHKEKHQQISSEASKFQQKPSEGCQNTENTH
jgi:hypothetical protein